MPQYFVSWTIDIDADNPQEAAEKARECQIKPDTIATVFQVYECREDGGALLASIDLSYPEESEHYTTADLMVENLGEEHRRNG